MFGFKLLAVFILMNEVKPCLIHPFRQYKAPLGGKASVGDSDLAEITVVERQDVTTVATHVGVNADFTREHVGGGDGGYYPAVDGVFRSGLNQVVGGIDQLLGAFLLNGQGGLFTFHQRFQYRNFAVYIALIDGQVFREVTFITCCPRF